MRKKIPIITVITDLATVHRLWFNDKVDECLTPTKEVYDLALKFGIDAEKVHITGLPVNPTISQEKRTKEAIRSHLGWQNDKPCFLVIGSKRVRNLKENLRVLNHSGWNIQLGIVCGGDEELYQTLQKTSWHIPTYLYPFVDNIPEMLYAADGAITKAGGLIVTESLACGTPLILIDINPGQEVGNAQMVVQNKAGFIAKTPVDTLEELCHWLENEATLLKEQTENAQKLGRPYAAFEVAERIWQRAKKGTDAKPKFQLSLSLERSKLLDWLKNNGLDIFSKEEVI